MSQSETVGCLGMGKIAGVKVQTDATVARPVDPSLKVLDANLIAIDRPTKLPVKGVQVQSMLARNKRVREFQVAPQFVRCSSAPRMIAGDGEPIAECAIVTFKARNVVALPAVHRDLHAAQALERSINVHAYRFVLLASEPECYFDIA